MRFNLRNPFRQIAFPRELSFYIVSFTLFLVFFFIFFDFKDPWIQIITGISLPVVFTYSTGSLFVRMIRMDNFDRYGILFRIISYSLIGLIINGSLFLSLGLLGLFIAPVLAGYFISVLIVYLIRNHGQYIRTRKNNERPSLSSILTVTAISGFSLGVAFWFQPPGSFPNLAGWDTYTHMLTVRTIITQQGIAELNLLYLPTMHYFYAAQSILTDTDPFLLLWGSIYFIFPLSGASLYFLGSRLSGNKLVGIGTSIFGITIGSTNEVLGFIFAYPSTYGLIITVLANTILLSVPNRKFGIVYLVSCALIYYPALAANFIIYIGSILLNGKARTYYFGITVAAVVFIVGIYFGGSLLGGGGVKLSTEVMWRILNFSYVGERGLILVLLGCFFIYYRRAATRQIILIGISTLVIFFVMISGSFVSAYRLEEFVRPYVAYAIGYGLGTVSTIAANLIMDLKSRNTKS